MFTNGEARTENSPSSSKWAERRVFVLCIIPQSDEILEELWSAFLCLVCWTIKYLCPLNDSGRLHYFSLRYINACRDETHYLDGLTLAATSYLSEIERGI